jgi:DNA repair exonuclease SbcCD ATPase subunit
MQNKDIKLSLSKLVVENFKNFKEKREFIFNDTYNLIQGENKTGKTSLFDSITWLLFNTNSKGQTKFEIKTKEDGLIIKNVKPSIFAEFIFTDLKKNEKEKLTLRKELIEKRSKDGKNFKANIFAYYINDVKTPANKYNKFINNLFDQDIFKLLTNPKYFNEQLEWEERLKLLTDAFYPGDIKQNIVMKNPHLKEIVSLLDKGNTVPTLRKSFNANIRKIEQFYGRLQAQQQEVSRSIEQIDDKNEIDVKSLEENKALLNKNLAILEDKLEKIKTGKEIENIRDEIKKKREDINKQQKEFEANEGKKNAAILSEKNNLTKQQNKICEEINTHKNKISTLRNELKAYRSEWENINNELSKKIEVKTSSDFCSFCHQKLPEEMLKDKKKTIEEQKQKILEQRQNLKEKQETISKAGKEITTEITDTLEVNLEYFQNKKNEINKQINKLVIENKSFEADPQIIKEIEILENKIKAMVDDVQPVIKQIEDEKTDIKAEISKIETKIISFNEVQKSKENTKERLKELEGQEGNLQQQKEEIDRQLDMLEYYVYTEAQMLEEEINKFFQFSRGRIKFINIKENTEIVRTCEMTVNGVFYPSLNTGDQTILGLDVIRVFSQHFNIFLPIWIDNSESITNLPVLPNQQIELMVVKGQEELLLT